MHASQTFACVRSICSCAHGQGRNKGQHGSEFLPELLLALPAGVHFACQLHPVPAMQTAPVSAKSALSETVSTMPSMRVSLCSSSLTRFVGRACRKSTSEVASCGVLDTHDLRCPAMPPCNAAAVTAAGDLASQQAQPAAEGAPAAPSTATLQLMAGSGQASSKQTCCGEPQREVVLPASAASATAPELWLK